MRASRSGYLFLLTILALTCPASAQTLVNIELEPAEITVGDRVQAKLTLVWDGEKPAATPRFPAWQKTWGEAEVLGFGQVETVSGRASRHIYTQTVTLTAFETGELELPRRTVAVPLSKETVEVPTEEGALLTVRSVLPEESEAGREALEPRPAAPLLALPSDRRFVWTASVLAGLCALAAVLMIHRLRRAAGRAVAAAAQASAPRILPPLEELLETLRKIDANAGSEPAHTALSLALRRFLARCLGINAVESTTSEVRRALRHGPLTDELAGEAVELLSGCDQVKYARLDVGAAVAAERLTSAGKLARRIDRHLRPPEPQVPLQVAPLQEPRLQEPPLQKPPLQKPPLQEPPLPKTVSD